MVICYGLVPIPCIGCCKKIAVPVLPPHPPYVDKNPCNEMNAPIPDKIPWHPLMTAYDVDIGEPAKVIVPKERIYLEEMVTALL